MKKIKTLRSAAKRLKKTASGNFKHKRSNLSHLLTKKASKRRRHLRHKSLISKADKSTVLCYLPYSIN